MGIHYFQKRIPMLIFFAIYLFTGYIGAMMLLFGPDDFWKMYTYFSGYKLPTIYQNDFIIILVLLHLPPLALVIGYELYLWLSNKYNFKLRIVGSNIELYSKIYGWLFLLSIVVALISLIRTDAFSNISAWTDYNKYIQIRYQLFKELSFFEFVNIYSLLPTLGALLIITKINKKSKIIVILIVLLSIFLINAFIFQKKPLITGLLLISISILTYFFLGDKPRFKFTKKMIFASISAFLFVFIIYIALVVAPVLSSTSEVYKPTDETIEVFADKSVQEEKDNKVKKQTKSENKNNDSNNIFRYYDNTHTNSVSSLSRNASVALYAFLSPITRTSAATMTYPIVFPNERDFYTLDLGQDILGIGTMPNDNIVIWNKLNPKLPGGSSAAPFHAVLYSQGGLLVSVVISLIVGVLLAFVWVNINQRTPTPIMSVLASLTLLFVIYIGLDSLRNSITVSYGVLWPIFMLICLMFAPNAINLLKTRLIKFKKDESLHG